jgi:hypothetical protein
VLCKPRAKASGWLSTASRLTSGDRGASRAVLQVPAIAAERSEEHAGKPYRGAAILANAGGAAHLFPAPDVSLGRRSNGHSSGRTFAGLRVARCSGPWTSENPQCTFSRTSRNRPLRSRRPSPTSARRWTSPIAPIPDRPRSGRDDNAALVRSVLFQRGAAAGRRLEVSGGIMNEGMKRSRHGLRPLPLIALLFGLPAFSMTSELAVEPPAPSISQCALIEVHDTAGIGWWSPAALEIDPTAAVNSGG